MRFDDTNPTKEKVEFVESIKEDIKWLGADWEDRLFFASDYFEQMYEAAVKLIKKGKAYVSDLTAEQIREYRGSLTEPGKDDPYNARSAEENLRLFEEMKAGKYADGEKVLRAVSTWLPPISICEIPSFTVWRTCPITIREIPGAFIPCTTLPSH